MKKKALKRLAVFTVTMSMLMSGMTAFAAETYVTKTGDNLSKIAKELYGDKEKWRDIYELNKDQIKDPNVIFANQTLILPDVGVVTEQQTTEQQTIEQQATEQQTTETEQQTTEQQTTEIEQQTTEQQTTEQQTTEQQTIETEQQATEQQTTDTVQPETVNVNSNKVIYDTPIKVKCNGGLTPYYSYSYHRDLNGDLIGVMYALVGDGRVLTAYGEYTDGDKEWYIVDYPSIDILPPGSDERNMYFIVVKEDFDPISE